MREVSEVGLRGLESIDCSQGLGDSHMGVMFLVSKCVDYKEVEVIKKLQGPLRDDFDVGQVGEGPDGGMIKAKAMSSYPAVLNFDRSDCEAVEIECGCDFSGLRPDVSGLMVGDRESPGVHAGEAGKGFGRTIEWEGGVSSPTEGSKFIKTGYVIKMLMSVKDGIDYGEFFPQSLLAEVGAAVDE